MTLHRDARRTSERERLGPHLLQGNHKRLRSPEAHDNSTYREQGSLSDADLAVTKLRL
jgi:hypothetical protein